jgi:Cu2+-exporting ATPase
VSEAPVTSAAGRCCDAPQAPTCDARDVPATDASRCFHCEGALDPASPPLTLDFDARRYQLCSEPCRQAAQTILARGLGRFYDHRRSPAASDRSSAVPSRSAAGRGGCERGRDHAVYDRQAALERYSRAVGEHAREVTLAVGGVHCAACSWLIEQAVAPLVGVRDISVNPATGRTLLTIDLRQTGLAPVLSAIEALGYDPQPLAVGEELTPQVRERRDAIGRLAVAGLGMMQVMMYSAAQYAGMFQGIDPAIYRLLGLVSLVVATPVVFYSGQVFFRSATQGLRRGIAGMDVPVALAIGAAYGWSVWVMLGPEAWVPAAAHTYFDSVVMLIFLLLLGRFVEMSVRHNAGQRTDALARLLPTSVVRIDANGDDEIIDRHEVAVGDRLRVLAGDALPADGVIEEGRGEVDESMLTGESAARARAPGEQVLGGTVLLGGSVVVRVTAVGTETALARIERMMDRAQADRPPLAGLADRVARYFVLALVLVATAVGAVWWQIDPARAFPIVLAVLVVTCPCALSLATPAALAAATTAFAREGLLVTRTAAVESLARIDTLVFDKTGTLTRAEPSIIDVTVLREGVSTERATELAAALERHSRHPLAEAFAGRGDGARAVDVTTEVGCGLEGTVDGRRLRIGQGDWVAPDASMPSACDDSQPLAAQTRIALGDEDGLIAVFTLDDGLRDDAPATMDELRDQRPGLHLAIASGDGEGPVRAVADRLGIRDAEARRRPEHKLALLRRLRGEGHRVGMVGDGINDAPVLAGADVSIAIASGTDLARVSADMVLLGSGLTPIATGVRHARKTVRVIRQNLLWAAGYNALALPLAASGLVTPWMAAIGMSASSLVVVLNAMRLRRSDVDRPSADAVPGATPLAGLPS